MRMQEVTADTEGGQKGKILAERKVFFHKAGRKIRSAIGGATEGREKKDL